MKSDFMLTSVDKQLPAENARPQYRHHVCGALSTQYHLNELVMTPAGPARMVGAFHDKQNDRTQAIVALEGQPFEGIANSARLAYVDWDQIKRKEPEKEQK